MNLAQVFRKYDTPELGAVAFVRGMIDDAELNASPPEDVDGRTLLPIVSQHFFNIMSVARTASMRERQRRENKPPSSIDYDISEGLLMVVLDEDLLIAEGRILAGMALAFEISLQREGLIAEADFLATLDKYDEKRELPEREQHYGTISSYTAAWILEKLEVTPI